MRLRFRQNRVLPSQNFEWCSSAIATPTSNSISSCSEASNERSIYGPVDYHLKRPLQSVSASDFHFDLVLQDLVGLPEFTKLSYPASIHRVLPVGYHATLSGVADLLNCHLLSGAPLEIVGLYLLVLAVVGGVIPLADQSRHEHAELCRHARHCPLSMC